MADYTEEETKAVTEFKRHFKEIKTARIAYWIRSELEKYATELSSKESIVADEKHRQEMLKLPAGTILLVKFHQLANQKVELVKHGRKYAHIKASDGRTWRYPYRALTDKIDDKLEKMTAQTNMMFQPMLKTLNDHAKGADQDG